MRVCQRCALPCSWQDTHGLHKASDTGRECDTGFSGVAEALCWYVFAEKKSFLQERFAGVERLAKEDFSKWIGQVDTRYGPALWPNGLKLALAYEYNTANSPGKCTDNVVVIDDS